MPEREKILKMLDEGKLTVEQAEKLLKTINEAKNAKKEEEIPAPPAVRVSERSHINKPLKGKLIISVESSGGDNVKINLPLKLASLAANMIPKDKINSIQADGVNIREILANITDIIDEIDEDIINVVSANGDHVRIYVEK